MTTIAAPTPERTTTYADASAGRPGRLAGKRAVITGGNSGIGLATAQAFVREGARVAIFGRDQATLNAAVATLGTAAFAVRGDVAMLDDIDRLMTAVQEQFGGLDVLFVNAGIGQFAPVDQANEAHFDQQFDVNVKGAYFTVQKALPLLQDGASVFFTGSNAGAMGMANASVYSATKAAVRSLARTLSADLKDRHIRVNVISPGPVATPILGRMGLPPEALEVVLAGMQAQVPAGRFAEADEIANAAVFLASDESRFFVGAELVADGGMSQL